MEILLKHTAPIGHQSRLIGTCSFAGEGAGALSNIDIIGHIAELLREAIGTVTGVEEERASFLVPIVGGVIEAIIHPIPPHVLEDRKG